LLPGKEERSKGNNFCERGTWRVRDGEKKWREGGNRRRTFFGTWRKKVGEMRFFLGEL